MTTETQKWELERWDEPIPLPEVMLQASPTRRVKICPFIGVPMPEGITKKKDFEYWLKRAWNSKREQSWDMLPLTRDEWFDKILDDWEMFYRRMDRDMTPRFKKQVKKLLKKGGFILVIGGRPAAQGDGKSIAGLMMCEFLQREFGIDVTPHVLFEHSHMQLVLEKEDTDDGWVILDIDEDLTATGEGSKNILIEISNTWQTNRKAKLIIISIGIDPGYSHPAVNIHLIPAGINEKFQTTRFGMFVNGRFKGWVRMQRLFRPEDTVKYGTMSEIAPLAEYKARAIAHSRKVSKEGIGAYPPEMEEQHIRLMMQYLDIRVHPITWAGMPPLDVLMTEGKQIGLPVHKHTNYPKRICSTAIDRWKSVNPKPPPVKRPPLDLVDLEQRFDKYVRAQRESGIWAKLPPNPVLSHEFRKQQFSDDDRINIGEINGIVATVAFTIQQEDRRKKRESQGLGNISGVGWEMFREALRILGLKYGSGKRQPERDAEALAWFFVPKVIEDGKEWKYQDVRREMGLSIKADSLGTQIRRLHSDIPTKDIGDLGEICVASWLDSLGARRPAAGGRQAGSKGLPDILCDIDKMEIAINVKTTLEDSYREHIPTTPEYDWRPDALIALIVPRRLTIALFPITEAKQTVNLNEGFLTTTESMADTLKELVKNG